MIKASESSIAGSMIVLETPRLLLRGAHESDAEDLFQCFKDEEVMRYWDSLPHANVDVTAAWVAKMIRGKNNGITDFVICLKPEYSQVNPQVVDAEMSQREIAVTKVIGKVGIWQGNEIGFLLNRRFWGQGFAVEAVRTVLDLAFANDGDKDNGNLDQQSTSTGKPRRDVVADVDPRNASSLGVLRKLGFEVYATKERTFQVGDEWVDSVYLSLKQEVWMQKRTEI